MTLNKENAIKDAMKKNIADPKDYCPLKVGMCRTDCVCWREFYAAETDHGSDMFIIRGGFCANGMFQERPALQL